MAMEMKNESGLEFNDISTELCEVKMKWFEVRDGDIRLRPFFERHYSARKKRVRHYKNWRRICPPGEHLILLTPNCDALFGWVKERIRNDGQEGVNCFVFRNESQILSSELIVEAVGLARIKWPHNRFFTYVNPNKTASRRGKNSQPGECFIQAGWKLLDDATPKGLVLLELLPLINDEVESVREG